MTAWANEGMNMMMMMMMIGNLSNFVNCSLEIQESLESTLTLLLSKIKGATCLSLTKNNKVFRAPCSRKKRGGWHFGEICCIPLRKRPP